MKRTAFKIICVLMCMLAVLLPLASCGKNEGKTALEYVGQKGKDTSKIDQSLMSLLVAVVNYQRSEYRDYLDMQISADADTTFGDLIVAEATSYAKVLLQAEYLNDVVFGYGLTQKQKDSIDDYIESLQSSFGSASALDNSLSVYGTNSNSLKRYVELSLKQSTLQSALYADGGPREISDEAMMDYFEKEYIIADHVLISLTGDKKEDGTITPLTEDEKAQKISKAENIYMQILSGELDFDAAIEQYGEDTYKTLYQNGYFVPKNSSSNLDAAVLEALREMNEGEMTRVQTQGGIYIVRKNEMDKTKCMSIADFAYALMSIMANADFQQLLESADGVKIYKDVINEIDPVTILPLNIDSLLQ